MVGAIEGPVQVSDLLRYARYPFIFPFSSFSCAS